MSTPPSNQPPKKPAGDIHVPRDSATDDKSADSRKRMPSPGYVNIRDEDYASGQKPLPADSPEAKALHDRPPKGKGQLGVGTAGDAARPSKEGIHDKPIPPRGQM